MSAKPNPDGLMIWPDLLERDRPEPDHRFRYGQKVMQAADLWVPAGGGPHPIVLMIHGGCWQSDVADRNIMAWIADDLRRRGIAVWNIDYRGVDRDGGGYPGTFHDVAAAADALPSHSAAFHLDLDRLISLGHSAGGHLALWLAGRHRLPAASPLHRPGPLRLRAAISLGGLPDLDEALRPPGSGCGIEVIHRLTGGSLEDTSVPRLAPLGIPQILVNGRQDRIIPAHYAEDYATIMRDAGDEVTVEMIDRTGHIELIAPESQAWGVAATAVERMLTA